MGNFTPFAIMIPFQSAGSHSAHIVNFCQETPLWHIHRGHCLYISHSLCVVFLGKTHNLCLKSTPTFAGGCTVKTVKKAKRP